MKAIAAKNKTLAQLKDEIKKDLWYAENITDFNDEKLKLLDWAGRRPKQKLTPPGHPSRLQVSKQGTELRACGLENTGKKW